MTDMTSFCIYMDWEEQLSNLTDEERGQIFSAIFTYKRTGVVPELPRVLSFVFSFIRQQLDRDAEKYEKKIEKRREAGQKGGRPTKEAEEPEMQKKQTKAKKANGFSEMQKKQTKAKKADTVTDTVTDTDTDTDTDTEYTTYTENNKDTDVSFPQSDFSNLPALPLVDGTEHAVSMSEIENYKALYPAVDVEQQFRAMYGWLDANPKNRKTRAGIKRFINAWLAREQNRAPRQRVDTGQTDSGETLEELIAKYGERDEAYG